ncbi:MAG: hypothetical protein GY866_00020 [Proteobacteria bacterium]|nr:hypothetical protein [Pseudomonadota bacterium]
MKKITKDTSLKNLALIVCSRLKQDGVDAVLTGGAVVSIYTENRYESWDLGFVTHSPEPMVTGSLSKIGFTKTQGRYYSHPDSDFFVEFPSPPIAVGNKPVTRFNEIRSESGYLKLLTPTHCVMDRLAAYYHWNDIPSLEQSIMVAKAHGIDAGEIEKWSLEEGMAEKYLHFLDRLE